MDRETDKRLTDVWKSHFKYHTSSNEDICCFTCCKGRVVGTRIVCDKKQIDIPGSKTTFAFEGVCGEHYSVYLPEDREVID